MATDCFSSISSYCSHMIFHSAFILTRSLSCSYSIRSCSDRSFDISDSRFDGISKVSDISFMVCHELSLISPKNELSFAILPSLVS